jgi:outer membrane protein TolC
MKKYYFSFLLLLLFSISNAQISISLSLEEVIQKAIEKNSSIKNKTLEIEKLNLQKKGIWNHYLPKVEVSALYSYFDNQFTADITPITVPILNIKLFEEKSTFDNYGHIFNGSIMAHTVLFSGLEIPNAAKAMEQKVKGSDFLKESEKDQIIKDVINTFDQLALLKEVEKLITDSEKRLQTESNRIVKAIEQGLAIPYDRDKIKLASLELSVKRIELEGKRKIIYKKIHYLTDLSEAEINKVTYDLVPFLLIEDQLSSENKQELKALESFKEASEYLLKKEKGSYLPKLGAFGGVTHSSIFNANTTSPVIEALHKPISLDARELTLSSNWMIGVGMKWELFDGFERKHKVHEAKINIEQLQNQLDDTKEKLILLLDSNYENYLVLNQKIDVAIQQEKVANNTITLAMKQYKEGLINISERLVAENDLYKTSVFKATTIIEQRLAAIETLIATGNLSKNLSN